MVPESLPVANLCHLLSYSPFLGMGVGKSDGNTTGVKLIEITPWEVQEKSRNISILNKHLEGRERIFYGSWLFRGFNVGIL